MLLFALSARSALATKCWQPEPQEHIARSDMVFFGEVLGGAQRRWRGGRQVAVLKVLRNYKGADLPLLRVLYRVDRGARSARRGWRFVPGDKLLVFAMALDGRKSGGRADASAGRCSMLPYYGRKGLHPRYWDLLSKMKGGDAARLR